MAKINNYEYEVSQILTSQKYAKDRLHLKASLKEGKLYKLSEVDEILKTLKGGK